MTQGKRRVGAATRCRLYVGRIVEAGVWLPPWLPLAPAQPPGRASAAPTCPPFVAGRARIRFDFRQLEVAGCLDFVRPEMRGLWDRLGVAHHLRGLYEEAHQQWHLVELLGPGDALVQQKNSGRHGEHTTWHGAGSCNHGRCMLRLGLVLFGRYAGPPCASWRVGTWTAKTPR